MRTNIELAETDRIAASQLQFEAIDQIVSRPSCTQAVPDTSPIISVRDEIWGSPGNISTLTGPSKSRKTFLIGGMTAALINPEIEVMGIRGHAYKPGGQVLYFDTEQGDVHFIKAVNRINTLSGLPPEIVQQRLQVHLMTATDSNRINREYIKYKIENTPNVVAAIIDGISDLMIDTNSLEEASDLTKMLRALTIRNDMHILTVLHTNKGDGNSRGHIGSELDRKAETVAIVEVDQNAKDISTVAGKFTRNKPFDDFAFEIDPEGLPVLTGIPVGGNSPGRPRTPYASDIDPEQYLDCASDWNGVSRDSAEEQVMRYFEIGEKTARKYINHMEEKGYVQKNIGYKGKLSFSVLAVK